MNIKLTIVLFASIISLNTLASNKGLKGNGEMETLSVSGTVVDEETGELLVGVAVVIEETNQKVYTDFEGNFTFNNVKKGTYNVKAELISYEQLEVKNIKVSKENEDLTFKLGHEN